MKATVNRKALVAATKVVHRAVSSRSTLPILGHILIEANQEHIILSATNLDIGIRRWVKAKIDEPGKITVPGRTFLDLTGVDVSDDEWKLSEQKGYKLKMDSGSLNSKLNGQSPDEFPAMPDPPEEGMIVFDADELKTALQQTIIAAATDDHRPTLTGINFDFKEDELVLASADGFRLSRVSMPLPETNSDVSPDSMVVPAAAVRHLLTMMNGANQVKLDVRQDGRAVFLVEDTMLIALLLSGDFPEYDAIVPKEASTWAKFSTDAMLKSCKAAHVFAREGANSVSLLLSPEKGAEVLTLSAQAAEIGSNEVSLTPNAIGGEGLDVSFNVKYLMDFLGTRGGDEVIFESAGSDKPGLFRFEGNGNFVHVIMPMHPPR